MTITVDDLAQEIRRVDGDHSLGAGALAEAIMPFIEAAMVPAPPIAASPKEWPKPDDRMRFLDEGGYPSDLAEARKHFAKGEVATVRDFHLGDWNSTVAFEGVPGWFNIVMFERLNEEPA